jgi:hypothetical protein
MATDYLVKLAINLSPRINRTPPEVSISVPGHVTHETLWKPKRIELEYSGSQGQLEVKFHNKNYNEYTGTHDMAVIIDSVEFFGISDPRFVWAGVYWPEYPEPWLSQQTPPPQTALTNHNYLGWNGVWRLNFDVPVFTWMHKTLGMGWIYQ